MQIRIKFHYKFWKLFCLFGQVWCLICSVVQLHYLNQCLFTTQLHISYILCIRGCLWEIFQITGFEVVLCHIVKWPRRRAGLIWWRGSLYGTLIPHKRRYIKSYAFLNLNLQLWLCFSRDRKSFFPEGEKKEMGIWKAKEQEITFNYSSTTTIKRNNTKWSRGETEQTGEEQSYCCWGCSAHWCLTIFTWMSRKLKRISTC